MRLKSLIASSLVSTMACTGLAADKGSVQGNSGSADGKMVARLKDGSEVVCKVELAAIPLVTSYAKLDLPVTNIVSMGFATESNEVTIVLRNGDTLHGAIGIEKMSVISLLGTLILPIHKVYTYHQSPGEGGRSLRRLVEGLSAPVAQ